MDAYRAKCIDSSFYSKDLTDLYRNNAIFRAVMDRDPGDYIGAMERAVIELAKDRERLIAERTRATMPITIIGRIATPEAENETD